MAVMTTLRAVVVLVAMLALPGWLLLTFYDRWRQWHGLQRWIVAVSIGIAFYPVLFYWTRWVLPFWTWGPYKISLLLGVFAVALAWRLRRDWRHLLEFDGLEWIALAVFGMTLFTRFWVIRNLPYPAWSDSLHHTLLTQLTAVQGKLPFTLEPYFPVTLERYHLGLYSLTAVVEYLAQVPAHTALLWTAQLLNGLCGIGVYLVLDRKVGRVGAVVGAAVVGLLSHQPAFYVNWGRFTQVAAQAILLPAWLLAWEAIAQWRARWPEGKRQLLWDTLVAAVLTGAVFLLHFRVALFFLPLAAISVAWELAKAHRDKRLVVAALASAVLGALALLVIVPAAWDLIRLTVDKLLNPSVIAPDTARQTEELYFEFPWSTLPILVSPLWLLILTAAGTVLGLLRRNKMVIVAVLWTVSLYLMGNAYLLGISWLKLTNLGAVLIMLYLPIGLVLGAAAEELLQSRVRLGHSAATRLILAALLCASFVASHVRVTEIESYRYFVTAEDIAAMGWIQQNTAADALFAVNTYFWLPTAPQGTDAGYWIPYFANRQTTAGVMLFEMGSEEYRSQILQMSSAEEQLALDNSALAELQEYGIDYIYIGTKGDFTTPGLNVAQLSQAEDLSLVYQTPHVSIFRIESPQ
jgi:hypothetical protein